MREKCIFFPNQNIIAVGEIDPLNRRHSTDKRPDVVVQGNSFYSFILIGGSGIRCEFISSAVLPVLRFKRPKYDLIQSRVGMPLRMKRTPPYINSSQYYLQLIIMIVAWQLAKEQNISL